MQQYNFDVELKDLNGNPGLDQHGNVINLSVFLASILCTLSKGDVDKIMGWAEQLHNKKKIFLDVSDNKTLYSIIYESPVINLLTKHQLFKILKDGTEIES